MTMKKKFLVLVLTVILTFSLLSVAAMASESKQQVWAPSGLTVLTDGSVIVTDVYQHAVWQQSANGSIQLLAGKTAVAGADGMPLGGYIDGNAANAAFSSPWAIVPFLNGYAVSDADNNVLRYIYDGQVTTIAGTGKTGSANGVGTKAALNYPTGLAAGADGSLYVADTGNDSIRKITTEGKVSLYAGSSAGCADGTLTTAKFSEPTGLAMVGGVLYVADTGNNRICKIENGQVTTVAGSPVGEEGLVDGTATTARFSAPQGIAADAKNLYIADSSNGAIRMLKEGKVSTLMAAGSGGNGLYPVTPRGLVIKGDKLLVGDIFAKTLVAIDLSKVSTSGRFADVKTTDWYYDAVEYVAEKTLMNGVGDTGFDPLGKTDRAMIATILYRLEGSPKIEKGASFSDVPAGTWYSPAIAWAGANNIVKGYGDGIFMPGQNITREEMAAILYRYTEYKKIEAPTEGMAIDNFDDSAKVQEWALPAMRWAIGQGVINGSTETTLEPQGTALRAEVATMLMRYATKVVK